MDAAADGPLLEGWAARASSSSAEVKAAHMGDKMTVQDLILNLKAAGFAEDQMKDYLVVWNAGEIREQLRLLSDQRKSLLDHIHQEEKQIHCLDYLVYQIGKGAVTA